MSLATLERALPTDERILLDTSGLIAYLGKPENVTPLITRVIDDYVKPGRNPATVSVVTAMELLVRPLQSGPGPEYDHLMDFLQRFPNLKAQPVDLAVAQEAASLRAQHKFAPADALVIATGIVTQVGHLVTNDEDWKKKLTTIKARIRVCYLEDHLPL